MKNTSLAATAIVLLTSVLVLGCGAGLATPASGTATEGVHHDDEHAAQHAHAHPDEGPHGGHLIELGQEEYHAEWVHDDATGTVTVYLLDSAAKNAVAIDQRELKLNLVVAGKPVQFTLAATEQPDSTGKSSTFSLQDEALAEAVDTPSITGRLNINIGGKPYSGVLTHHDHEESAAQSRAQLR